MTNKNNYQTPIMPRSWLFVPAIRPDRFSNALNSQADAVIIDLEDTVDANSKDIARQNIVDFFANNIDGVGKPSQKNVPVWIRLNNNQQLETDLLMCAQLPKINSLAGIILPKVEDAKNISLVNKLVDKPVVVQIESAKGMNNLANIAKAKGLLAISYGRLDICNEFNLRAGTKAEEDFFRQFRLQLALQSKINSLQGPIESIFADFKNDKGLQELAKYTSDLGFSGVLCIHPKQVPTVNNAFTPSDAQVHFAKKVVEHYEATGESVFSIDGIMVDLPVIVQCKRLVN